MGSLSLLRECYRAQTVATNLAIARKALCDKQLVSSIAVLASQRSRRMADHAAEGCRHSILCKVASLSTLTACLVVDIRDDFAEAHRDGGGHHVVHRQRAEGQRHRVGAVEPCAAAVSAF